MKTLTAEQIAFVDFVRAAPKEKAVEIKETKSTTTIKATHTSPNGIVGTTTFRWVGLLHEVGSHLEYVKKTIQTADPKGIKR